MGLLAPAYDFLTAPLERRALSRWRERTWADVPQRGLGLEIGAGTGANFPYYPEGAQVVATDVSLHMLRQAKGKTGRAGTPQRLCLPRSGVSTSIAMRRPPYARQVSRSSTSSGSGATPWSCSLHAREERCREYRRPHRSGYQRLLEAQNSYRTPALNTRPSRGAQRSVVQRPSGERAGRSTGSNRV